MAMIRYIIKKRNGGLQLSDPCQFTFSSFHIQTITQLLTETLTIFACTVIRVTYRTPTAQVKTVVTTSEPFNSIKESCSGDQGKGSEITDTLA